MRWSIEKEENRFSADVEGGWIGKRQQQTPLVAENEKRTQLAKSASRLYGLKTQFLMILQLW